MNADQVRAYLQAQAFDEDTKRRILMTLQCPDTDQIPKVAGAGEIFEENGCRFQLMHNGVRVLEDCYYGKWMTELIRLLRGHHEPQEEKVFDAILKHISPGATMLELGSFWSYYSLWFLRSIPKATTYMLEPDPNNLEIGRRNFDLNGRNGQFFQYVLACYSGPPEKFYCESDGVVRAVPRMSVDEFIQQNHIDRVDLLLADVQGAELELLKGAQSSIAEGKIRFVFVSTHHHSISGDPILHHRCLHYLQDAEAHIIAAHSVSESFSGDGLIAASLRRNDREIPAISISKNWSSNGLFREIEFDLAEAQVSLALVTKQVLELQEQYQRQGRGLGALTAELTELRRLLAENQGVLSSVLNSESWKLTSPLRKLSQLVRRTFK